MCACVYIFECINLHFSVSIYIYIYIYIKMNKSDEKNRNDSFIFFIFILFKQVLTLDFCFEKSFHGKNETFSLESLQTFLKPFFLERVDRLYVK